MTETTQPTEQLYSIVVLGEMNPRLHHPFWYKAIKLVTEAELEAAMRSQTVCTPQFARFQIPELTIGCYLDRWEVSCANPAERPRMLQIASEVFVRLHETPVSLFAFNNDFTYPTNVSDVATALVRRAESAGFKPIVRSAHAGATFTIMSGDERVGWNVRIEPRRMNELFVGANVNHKPVTDSSPHFNLRPQLEEHFDKDHELAKTHAIDILKSINSGD
jgi:hypothetical protein